jgi:hypothetical protein
MPSDANLETRIDVMSANLRRGFEDWSVFKRFVIGLNLKEVSANQLRSISDSFLIHGTKKEKAISGIISTFVTIGVRTLDTMQADNNQITLPEYRGEMYDGICMVDFTQCDTYQNYFERIDPVIREDDFLYKLWRELKLRLKTQSPTLTAIDNAHKDSIYRRPPYSRHLPKHYEDE